MATKTKPAASAAPQLKEIAISSILPDPNQPRKYFSPVDDKDLLESIKAQGILQPLLIRPSKCSELIMDAAGHDTSPTDPKVQPFLLVCGERRFRAAQAAGLQTVPALIRELDDEAALEAQIVENLQRKDVHPMEEAEVFEILGKKGLTREQIGARVGKGDRFVRARLVLCGLNRDWRDLFLRYVIDLETALQICQYSDALQKQILKDQELSKADMKDPDLKIKIRDFSAYRGDLSSACFDKQDASLIPDRGACIGCPFNSATASLFPDDAKSPRCMNLECFRKKTDTAFERILAKAKEDPTIILVKEGYRAEDDKLVQKLKKDGLTVIGDEGYNEVTIRPHPGTFAEWKRASLDNTLPDEIDEQYDEDEDDDWNKKRYKEAVDDHERDKKDCDKGVKSGKIKTALIVQGTRNHAKGATILVELTPQIGGGFSRVSGPSPAQKVASNKATAGDYELEITRLQEDIDRTKKRQGDNAFSQVVNHYKASPISHSVGDRPLSKDERALMALFFLEQLGGLHYILSEAEDNDDSDPVNNNAAAALAEALGFKVTRDKKGTKLRKLDPTSWDLDYGDDKSQEKVEKRLWDFVSQISETQLALLFRRTILHHYGKNPDYIPDTDRFIFSKLAAAADPEFISVKQITEEAYTKGEKRIQNAKAKISEYKAKIKEISQKKASKPVAKKTAKPAAKKETGKN